MARSPRLSRRLASALSVPLAVAVSLAACGDDAPSNEGVVRGSSGSTGAIGGGGRGGANAAAGSAAQAAGASGNATKAGAGGMAGQATQGGSGSGGANGGSSGAGGTGGTGAAGSPGQGGSAGKNGTAGSAGAPPEPPPCTTRITYGSRWIHPANHPGFDVVAGNVGWDGVCTHDGANSYATLSNGWKPYFEGHGCTIAFDRTGCAGAPESCATRVGYGPSWLAAPNHPNAYDDLGGPVTWSGECNDGASSSSGVLSNGWTPTFSGKNHCELSFSYQQCGGLYTNPVIATDCPDPGVIRAGNGYHLACTGGDGGGTYVVRSSDDLVSWKKSGHVFPSGQGPSWADGSFWAPEIHPVGGGFVAYFSAHEKGKTLAVGAATGKSVTGPFVDVGGPIVRAPVGAIDVSQFADDQGALYLLWKDDGNSQGKKTPIHGQRLAANGHTLEGNPSTLITNDLGWEGGLVEAPWITRHGGQYYLFYSANAYYDGRYAVGVARSASPLGPYTKKGAPILTTNERWVGPGHCSVIDTPAGRTMMIYHAWRAGAVNTPGSGRVVLVDEVVWKDGWPEVPTGPSFVSKPLPLSSVLSCYLYAPEPMSDHAPLSLPSELLRRLHGAHARDILWHVRLLAGLSSLVGETHLVGTRSGQVRIFTRSSMLAPFDELRGITALRIERGTLRTLLHIDHDYGTVEHTLPLGYREITELAALLHGDRATFDPGAIPDDEPSPMPEEPNELPPPPAPVAPPPGAYAPPTVLATITATATAPPLRSGPPPELSPALRRERQTFVNLLVQRTLPARPRFAVLLEGTVPKATRRVLLDARLELERGRVAEARALLEGAARSPRWHVRLALAETLLERPTAETAKTKDDGLDAKRALAALDAADQAGAPAALSVPLRERAARRSGSRRTLLLALRRKRELIGDGDDHARWDVEAEIRSLEARGAEVRAERSRREADNAAASESRGRARAERKRAEREQRPPKPAAPVRPRKVKAPVDPSVETLEPPGKRALRRAEESRERAQAKAALPRAHARARPTLAPEVKPELSLLWIVAAALVLAGLFAYAMQRRSVAVEGLPSTTTTTTR